MADHLSAEKRSWNMSRIHGKDTSIEKRVRSYLFRCGFRFRKNDPRLPGKPDIVLPKYHTAIFVHGCFWHRHTGCKDATTPKTNVDFWMNKFQRNINNDIKHTIELESLGWRVITIWECDIENRFEDTMNALVSEIDYKKSQMNICKEKI